MVYDSDLRVTLSTVSANFAHTCGNVTSIIFNDFKDHFPKNFFKKTNINTRIALRQFQDIRKTVDLKIQKPFFSVQPKLIVEDPEFNIDFTHKLYGNNLFDLARPDYMNVKFFKDPNKGICVDFNVDRTKLAFEFNILVSTEFQQFNTVAHMKNTFRIGHPYQVPATLETVLPECIVEKISEESGVPIKDKSGSVIPFLRYMNTISNIPITYGRQTSTGTDRFFMVIRTNIFMTYSDLSISDDNEGQSSDKYILQMQLETEFNYPSVFYYLSHNGQHIESNESELSMDNTVQLHYTIQRTLIPERDNDNYVLFLTCAYDIDTDEDADRTPIGDLIIEENREIVKNLKHNKKPIDHFIHVLLYEDGRIMNNHDEYYIDWETEEIVISMPNKKKTYRLAIYLNQSLLNAKVLESHSYK